jgi:hypothetical protein
VNAILVGTNFRRLNACASTSVPLKAFTAFGVVPQRITNAAAVVVVPDKVFLAVTQIKADTLVNFWNPEEVSSWAGSRIDLAAAVSDVEPFCAVA